MLHRGTVEVILGNRCASLRNKLKEFVSEVRPLDPNPLSSQWAASQLRNDVDRDFALRKTRDREEFIEASDAVVVPKYRRLRMP